MTMAVQQIGGTLAGRSIPPWLWRGVLDQLCDEQRRICWVARDLATLGLVSKAAWCV